MINGIDVQHLQTVHHLPVDLKLSLHQEGAQIDFTLSGEFLNTNWRERLGRTILGPRYAYSMRYAHGCLGLLTMMKEVRWIPELHMIYAYRPTETGETFIQPIYVTKKRRGLLGWVITHLLLWLTRLSYYALRGEDGKIYDNIQFRTDHLLPVDAPIAHYVKYVNGLVPSQWSSPLPKSLSPGRGTLTASFKLSVAENSNLCSPSPQGEEAGG